MRGAGVALRLLPRAAGLLPRAVFALPRRVRRPLLIVLVLAVALGAAYIGWVRDLSAFQVTSVQVTGVTSDDAPRVRAALTEAARSMTTLHVREDALRRAVAPYSVVAAVRADADLPRTLRIRVTEQRPVALVEGAGGRVPVGPDGTLLRRVRAPEGLPLIGSPSGPGRMGGTQARAAVRIAALAPAELLGRIERVERGQDGWVAIVRDGPELLFGAARGVGTKWAAAAAVLADPAVAEARYVDLRLPDRPAVGGLPAEPAAEDQEAAGDPDAPPAAGAAPAAPGTGTAPGRAPVVPEPGSSTSPPAYEPQP